MGWQNIWGRSSHYRTHTKTTENFTWNGEFLQRSEAEFSSTLHIKMYQQESMEQKKIKDMQQQKSPPLEHVKAVYNKWKNTNCKAEKVMEDHKVKQKLTSLESHTPSLFNGHRCWSHFLSRMQQLVWPQSVNKYTIVLTNCVSKLIRL